MAVEDSFELASLLCTSQAGGDTVPSLLRQFEGSRTQRVTRVFNSSRQIGKLAQVNTALGCLLRNGIYKLFTNLSKACVSAPVPPLGLATPGL
jgi:2-polyprenyl-6-methoxyphenol hydroxylase-like FAD-dependent oxidoreductase